MKITEIIKNEHTLPKVILLLFKDNILLNDDYNLKMITVIITIIECFLLLIFTFVLMWMYAAKDRTPIYVRVLTVIGWFLGFAIILFIPLDIYIVRSCS